MFAYDLDWERERAKLILKVVSAEIAKNYYDPKLNGLDWVGLTEQARQRIEKANSNGEMLTAIYWLIDQLHDSHTRFLPPGRVHKLLFGFSTAAFGDEIRINRIAKGGQAEAAGLQVGDRILAVNGFATDRKTIDPMMFYYRLLRPRQEWQIVFTRGNQPPSTVTVSAKVKEGKFLTDITDGIEIWNLIREMQDQEPDYHRSMHADGIGYVSFKEFGRLDFTPIVDDISKARAVVLDLRGNRGGLIEGLEELIGHFEAKPTLIARMVGRKKTESIEANRRVPNLIPKMVIMVDSESASAAEVLARHFQKTGKAVVIGDRTAGYVNASRYFSHAFGTNVVALYGVQISTGKLEFPDGEILEERGVSPDAVCIPTAQEMRERQDRCLLQAFSLARKSIGLDEAVPDDTRTELQIIREKLDSEAERQLRKNQ